MTGLSFSTMTWRRPASMLENSLWTLSHQTVAPDEIVVCEASPEEAWHAETRRVCSSYPLVRLVEARWSRFNVSRGFNCAIRASSPASVHVAVVGMELLFSENFVEVLLSKVGPDRYVRSACGTLPQGVIPAAGPPDYREQWDWYGRACRPYPPHIAYGAMVCAPRAWWHGLRGYDEARRPYSYPDIDMLDRARRSDLEDCGIDWEEAQVIHPWHEPSGLFYSISGYAVDNRGADKDVVRNPRGWGELEGDEPVRIPGT